MTGARCYLLPILLLLTVTAFAGGGAYYQFDSPEQEARFYRVIHELHCPVCQGQSIADSNAELARDMRAKVHELIVEGKSDDQVLAFMTQRYGDYVLFRPPVTPATWLLWFAPGLLAVVAIATVFLVTLRRAPQEMAPPLNAEERERLRRLLDHGRNGA